jgi:hypothetical protein
MSIIHVTLINVKKPHSVSFEVNQEMLFRLLPVVSQLVHVMQFWLLFLERFLGPAGSYKESWP